MAHFKIAILPGDGIGPEVMTEGLKVLKAIEKSFGHKFTLEECLIGGAAIDATKSPLPAATIKLAKASDATLLAAVGGPKWDNQPWDKRPEQGLLNIRAELGVFANLRPAKLFSALSHASPIQSVKEKGHLDLLVVRELTSGLYFGKPRGIKTGKGNRGGRSACNTMVYTESEIERVARVGFELARGRRRKLCSVDKANVLEVSKLWRQVVTRLQPEYPDVELSHMYVDNCAMQLIRNPYQFDVIVTENMFGDILSDEASMLTGSLGMLPSASLGAAAKTPVAGAKTATAKSSSKSPKAGLKSSSKPSSSKSAPAGAMSLRPGLYEPVHGSAPDIAGQNKANPIAMISSISMMFRYSLGLSAEADRIDKAIEKVLENGCRCADIQSPGTRVVSTTEMGDQIARTI